MLDLACFACWEQRPDPISQLNPPRRLISSPPPVGSSHYVTSSCKRKKKKKYLHMHIHTDTDTNRQDQQQRQGTRTPKTKGRKKADIRVGVLGLSLYTQTPPHTWTYTNRQMGGIQQLTYHPRQAPKGHTTLNSITSKTQQRSSYHPPLSFTLCRGCNYPSCSLYHSYGVSRATTTLHLSTAPFHPSIPATET